MSNIPDYYQFINIKADSTDPNSNEKDLLKLFCVWTGGYGRGDSWKLNSGVKNISLRYVSIDTYPAGILVLDVHGYSGSIYTIPNQECTYMSSYGASILDSILDGADKLGVECELISLKQALEMFYVQY